MAIIHSIETLLEKRRQGNVEIAIPFSMEGKQYLVSKKIVNGEMSVYELPSPIGEMMTNEATRKELMQKIVLDVELGREQIPTLYGPIYDRIDNADFPKTLEPKWALRGLVVFLEHLEGGEVKFGSMVAEKGPTVSILGYAAGFEWTKEMQIFNHTFDFEIINKAFGEAHNALLNHIHFAPILTATYAAGNKTAAQYVKPDGSGLANATGSHYLLSIRETIRKALIDAAVLKRPGTILLVAGGNRQDIKDAIGAVTINGAPEGSLSDISTIVSYDGWTTAVGKKETTYAGVTAGKAYLIRPKRGFKELVKQDLQINSTMGDITRLVESQTVGDVWRGVFAAIGENVQEITLPTKP